MSGSLFIKISEVQTLEIWKNEDSTYTVLVETRGSVTTTVYLTLTAEQAEAIGTLFAESEEDITLPGLPSNVQSRSEYSIVNIPRRDNVYQPRPAQAAVLSEVEREKSTKIKKS